jgi:hypothetical protein
MIDDDFNFDDDENPKAERPAFFIGADVTPAELLVLEEMHRNGASPEFRGAGLVLFTIEDEETGEEHWEEGEAKRWQKIMQWPREPRIDEALAFRLNADARLEARFWPRLLAARSGQA